MDQDTLQLIFSVIMGIVGVGYCSYGKNNPIYRICGIGLLVIPFFIASFIGLLVLGVALMLLPYLLDR